MRTVNSNLLLTSNFRQSKVSCKPVKSIERFTCPYLPRLKQKSDTLTH